MKVNTNCCDVQTVRRYSVCTIKLERWRKAIVGSYDYVEEAVHTCIRLLYETLKAVGFLLLKVLTERSFLHIRRLVSHVLATVKMKFSGFHLLLLCLKVAAAGIYISEPASDKGCSTLELVIGMTTRFLYRSSL